MKKDARKHSVVFYNVENLYDTIDNKRVKDSDFTPMGDKHWTLERLDKKLNDLANTIHSISNHHPVLIGLAEVENAEVTQQLLDTHPLKNYQYKLIHQDSPDNRGIDTCLVYDEEYIKYLSHQYLRIHFPWNAAIKTRDVLFFECEINGEEFWIVVNHWPSRSSNSSEEKRAYVAKSVRERLDQIISSKPESKIIVMGDFNDEPNDLSVERYLGAKRDKKIDKNEFFNLANELFESGQGTCVHEEDWLMIDQIMINRNLLQNNNLGVSVRDNQMQIFAPEELIFHKREYSQPNHTYSGDKYEGGISDHLPVFITLD